MIRVKYNEEKDNYVCALDAISIGTPIITFIGVPIDFSETLELGNRESFALQIDRDQYLYLDAPHRFFNHSCEPNCGLTPELLLVAIRDIAADEELTYDYSTTMLEHHWKMKCNCKSGKCRNVVADFNTLPLDLQSSYLDKNIVQSFIRRALGIQYATK